MFFSLLFLCREHTEMGGRITTRVVLAVFFLSWTQGEKAFLKHYTSTYGLLCFSDCIKRIDDDYYSCETMNGADYCSVGINTDYKGNTCKDHHPCAKYGTDQYRCRVTNGYSYCGRVETSPVQYISSTYQSVCRDNCSRGTSGSYYWCNTEHGWDYCSVEQNVTSRVKRCRPDHPCDRHGYSYYWCKTDSGWDYCGPVQTAGA